MIAPRVDGHTHAGTLEQVGKLAAICDTLGYARANVLCQSIEGVVNENPAGFAAKVLYPGRFYAFGALDHTAARTLGRISSPPLAEQVERLIAIGMDGLKMIEGKPTSYESLNIPLDGPYFDDLFGELERTEFPVLWHVADPEEFWDPALTPEWARKRGWGYSENTVPKETLYAQVEAVLERHPGLSIIFAHFYFLSADLPRAARLLERYPGVHLDLALGVELLFNLSRDAPATRDFFMEYSSRIVFGTDMFPWLSAEEARARSGIVARLLESDDTYTIPDGGDYLLGPPGAGVIHGLSLPDDVCERIFHENFERIAGPEPRPLNRNLAADECRRLIRQIEALHGRQTEPTEAARVLEVLGG